MPTRCGTTNTFSRGVRSFIYDIDSGFGLIKSVAARPAAILAGAIASAATGMLYVSYGPDGNSGNGSMFKYDLVNNVVLWDNELHSEWTACP